MANNISSLFHSILCISILKYMHTTHLLNKNNTNNNRETTLTPQTAVKEVKTQILF